MSIPDIERGAPPFIAINKMMVKTEYGETRTEAAKRAHQAGLISDGTAAMFDAFDPTAPSPQATSSPPTQKTDAGQSFLVSMQKLVTQQGEGMSSADYGRVEKAVSEFFRMHSVVKPGKDKTSSTLPQARDKGAVVNPAESAGNTGTKKPGPK